MSIRSTLQPPSNQSSEKRWTQKHVFKPNQNKNKTTLHACGFNISASSVSQQLLALTWFQYLTSPPVPLTKILNFLHSLDFNIYTLQGVQRPSPCDTLGFPPPSHSALFFSISTLHTSVPHLGAFTWLHYLNFPPCASHQFPAFIRLVSTLGLLTTFCMHRNLVSMSKLTPLSLNNLLRPSGFNIYVYISPTSPPVPLTKLPKLPAFIGFQYLYFRRSLPITSCVNFVLISKLPPRCPTTTSQSIFLVPAQGGRAYIPRGGGNIYLVY